MEYSPAEVPQDTIFTDLELEHHTRPASLKRRFANYLIDIFSYYLFIFFVSLLLAMISAATGWAFMDFLTDEGNSSKAVVYLYAFALLIIYYTLMEGLTKGRSLGKLITGTIAIRETGAPITWPDALKRSLFRAIPFEPLSVLSGSLWHDSGTHTIVVRKR
jgi:uncharacterized RDD family membrane protein YckC